MTSLYEIDKLMIDLERKVERQRLNILISLCEATAAEGNSYYLILMKKQKHVGIVIFVNMESLIEGKKMPLSAIREPVKFGVGHIINILIGSETENILKFS